MTADGTRMSKVQSDGSHLPSFEDGYWIGRPYQCDDHSPPWSPLFSLAPPAGGGEPKGVRYPIGGHATGEKTTRLLIRYSVVSQYDVAWRNPTRDSRLEGSTPLQACAYFPTLGYKYQTRPSVIRSLRPKVCLVELPANTPTRPLTLSRDQVTSLSVSAHQPDQTRSRHKTKCANTNCKPPNQSP